MMSIRLLLLVAVCLSGQSVTTTDARVVNTGDHVELRAPPDNTTSGLTGGDGATPESGQATNSTTIGLTGNSSGATLESGQATNSTTIGFTGNNSATLESGPATNSSSFQVDNSSVPTGVDPGSIYITIAADGKNESIVARQLVLSLTVSLSIEAVNITDGNVTTSSEPRNSSSTDTEGALADVEYESTTSGINSMIDPSKIGTVKPEDVV